MCAVSERSRFTPPGWHTVTLGEQDHLAAGLYVIRLTQSGRSLTSRAAIVR